MKDCKNLILVGGGGHCKSVIDVAEDLGYNVLGILDHKDKVGTKVLKYDVIGTDDDIPKYVDKALFVITVGQIKDNSIRRKIAGLIEKAGGKYATLIANDAHVSKYAVVGEGSVVMHKAIINADSHIGRNCIINTMTNIEHDVIIGEFCHVSTGCMINGDTRIGDNVFVGSNSEIHNCKHIVDNVILAAGSVVYKDIDEPGVYASDNLVKFNK
ncbi:MAG: acetyltransferase [Bacteroidales bacterium]|nr:acetyltransferase [Bacteroidales bacterium]